MLIAEHFSKAEAVEVEHVPYVVEYQYTELPYDDDIGLVRLTEEDLEGRL